MKKSVLFLIFLAITLIGVSQSEGNWHTISLTINGLEEAKGKVGLQLMNKDKSVVESKWVEVDAKTVDCRFTGIKSGTYAIRFFHDANDNDEMDTGLFGIPKEGYGNSNDVQGFFGPPDFEDQLFELNGDKSIVMKTFN